MEPGPLIELLIGNLVKVLTASVVVIFISHHLRLSPVIGMLITGLLIGPSGIGIVQRDQVEILAEIGIVILLFTVGLEFSLVRLRQNWRPFLIGGGLQVAFTVATAAGIAALLGVPWRAAIFLGFLAALSSTAIVLKLYADRRELNAPQGTLAAGVLLFQDFCLAPMIILTPLLAGAEPVSALHVVGRLGSGVLLVAASFAAARLGVPILLHWIVRTRVREIFVLASLAACLGMALLTARLGFSLALGAFLAGLVISDSEYSHQVIAEVLPFRDVFNSLFFISVGMLVQFDVVRAHWYTILALGIGVMVLKALIATGVVRALLYPPRIALVTGLSLAQVGEFSFVLGGAGLQLGLLDMRLYQEFLSASIFTMMLTPLVIQAAPRLAARAGGMSHPGRGARPHGAELRPEARRSAHVILVGYGLNGRNVARVLRETAIPYVVLELNGSLVREARAEGHPVVYGDATRQEILEGCDIREASMLVVAISDMAATRQAVRAARSARPDLHILARTRAVSEVDELYRLGADAVIPEEFETAVAIVDRVLEQYHVPRNIIDAQLRIIRGEGYGVLRGASLTSSAALDRIAELLDATLTETFQVTRGSSADGRSLRDLQLRRRTGVIVIAVVRAGKPITNPDPDLPLQAGDTLVLVGNHAAIEVGSAALGGRSPGVAAPGSDLTISTQGDPDAHVS